MALSQFSQLQSEREHELSVALQTLPKRKRRILGALILVFIASIVGLLWYANDAVSVEVPSTGGTLREGVVGTARFINPLLAITDADRDLTMLTYSGLMRATPDGAVLPDLAASHAVSEDGLTHTFILREDLTWHDGKPLTTADVAFTVTKAQDPLLKSPRRPSWEGVRVEVVDEQEIKFHLKHRYNAFTDTATMGILPEHLWNDLSVDQFSFTELNTMPIGSGPYKVKKVRRDDDGIPRSMELVPFADFALGKPHIRRIEVVFYANESALTEGFRHNEIDSLSAISAESASRLADNGANIIAAPLPRIFAVFFNQNKAQVFAQKEVREALSMAVDRNLIIDTVLKGYGTAINSPLSSALVATSTGTSTSPLLQARAHLEGNGWSWNEDNQAWTKKVRNETITLAFTVATAETPELRQAADMVVSAWKSLGAQVELKVYELGDLNRDVIRPREYEALLFGQVLGRTPDLSSFWHSSQRLDPGLNIAMYTNTTVDKLLEELRGGTNPDDIQSTYAKIDAAISADVPAVFLYTPDLLYIIPKHVHNVRLPLANTASDRFAAIHDWHIATDKVWKIFTNNN